MENIEKLKEAINEALKILQGEKCDGIFRWVSVYEKKPRNEGYYIVLKGESNPNFPHRCYPAVHFWNKSEWSSETKFYLEKIETFSCIPCNGTGKYNNISGTSSDCCYCHGTGKEI